jgi:hypothetical protein
MREAPQGPGDIEADGQVAGRLGQQDSPGFGGLRIGEGGLCLGEQRSLLLSVGPGGQPGGESGKRPVACAERTQGDRARQKATVTVAHRCPDFVRHPRQHRLPQPLRPRRIGSAGQRVQAGSRHLARVIARHLPECAVRPHGDELTICGYENNSREGAVLQNLSHSRPREARTRCESNLVAAITRPRLIHSTIVAQVPNTAGLEPQAQNSSTASRSSSYISTSLTRPSRIVQWIAPRVFRCRPRRSAVMRRATITCPWPSANVRSGCQRTVPPDSRRALSAHWRSLSGPGGHQTTGGALTGT